MSREVIERLTAPFEAQLGELHERDTDNPVADLRSHVFGVFRRIANDPGSLQVLAIDYGKVVADTDVERNRHCTNLNNWTHQVRRRIARASAQGLLKSGIEVEAASIAISVMIDGLIRTWMFSPPGFDLLRHGQCLIDSYL